MANDVSALCAITDPERVRRFKDAGISDEAYTGDGQQPHDTDSFGRDDLPLVAKLADRAHTFIFECGVLSDDVLPQSLRQRA